jgi:glycosyltransferase involved in cell wall biosynthesis
VRICIVNHFALPPGASGGPTRHLGLSRALARRGHEVTIVASAFDHYTRTWHRTLDGPCSVETIDGVTYAWVRTPPYRRTAGRIPNMLTFAARTALRRTSGALALPDVVIGSSPHLLAAWAARRLARRAAVPFVVEVRDVWPQSLIDLGDFGPRHPAMIALRRLEQSLYRSADHVLCVPPLAVEHVLASGGRAGAVSVLPNGVELSAAPAAPAAPARAASPFTVVYAGTIGHANGLEVCVDAAAVLAARGVDDVRFRLVGAGPERGRLAERIAAAGLRNITIDEPVRQDEVPALLATADACLMILRDSPVFRWGVSPTKLFDYFAAAKPVVFAVSSPVDPVAEAGAGVRAAAGDPVALADAVLRLRDTDPAEREAMGRRGRRYAEERHGFDALASQLEHVLDAVVRRAPVTTGGET